MTRVGTQANPLILRVPSEERLAQVMAFCESKNWFAICELHEEREEDLSDLKDKLNSLPIHFDEPKVGRNEPGLCGSGKKYKKCCAIKAQLPLSEALKYGDRICAHCAIEEWLQGS